MKKIIPLLAAMLLLAGCGNNSTGNQTNPNSSPGKAPPGSIATNSFRNVPAMGTMTNDSAMTNQNPNS